MDVKIIEHYGITDPEFICDFNTNVELNGKYVFGGDQYHDKIAEKIEGYILGLKHGSNEEVNVEKIKLADNPDWD